MRNHVSDANVKRSKCWHWCGDCGERVFVNRSQQWKAARPKCMRCGSSYLVTEKPANAKE